MEDAKKMILDGDLQAALNAISESKKMNILFPNPSIVSDVIKDLINKNDQSLTNLATLILLTLNDK